MAAWANAWHRVEDFGRIAVNDRSNAAAKPQRGAGAVEPGELITGLPEVYGTTPVGRLPDPAAHGA